MTHEEKIGKIRMGALQPNPPTANFSQICWKVKFKNLEKFPPKYYFLCKIDFSGLYYLKELHKDPKKPNFNKIGWKIYIFKNFVELSIFSKIARKKILDEKKTDVISRKHHTKFEQDQIDSHLNVTVTDGRMEWEGKNITLRQAGV